MPNEQPSDATTSIVTLEHIKPFPKAGPRKTPKNNGHKKGKTMVLTSTPVKQQRELEHEQSIIKNKRCPPVQNNKARKVKVAKALIPAVKDKLKQTLGVDSAPPDVGAGSTCTSHCQPLAALSGDDDDLRDVEEMLCDDDSSVDFDCNEFRRDATELADLVNQDKIDIDNYVLVQFCGKKAKAYYVGKVVGVKGDDIEIHFMRRSDMHKGANMSFNFQSVDIGISVHQRQDIVLKLPPPSYAGGTKRCAGKHIFSCDLSMYDPL